MSGIDWRESCFKQVQDNEETKLNCLICNQKCTNLESPELTKDHHLYSSEHMKNVHQKALQYLNKEIFGQEFQEGENEVSQTQGQQFQFEINLFSYELAKKMYYDDKKKLNQYFDQIINVVLISSQKQFSEGSMKTYISIIRKFFYLTFYLGFGVYSREVLLIFLEKKKPDQTSILKKFLICNFHKQSENINQNYELSNQFKKNSIISHLEDEFFKFSSQKQSQLDNDQYFFRFIEKLKQINQDRLALALLIMFSLGISREQIYKMQFEYIIQLEVELSQDQDNIQQKNTQKLKNFIVQDGKQLINKFNLKPNAYIYHVDLREAQKTLKHVKEQIISILLTEPKIKDLLGFINYIDEIYINSICKQDQEQKQKYQTQKQQSITEQFHSVKKINKQNRKIQLNNNLNLNEQNKEFDNKQQDIFPNQMNAIDISFQKQFQISKETEEIIDIEEKARFDDKIIEKDLANSNENLNIAVTQLKEDLSNKQTYLIQEMKHQ